MYTKANYAGCSTDDKHERKNEYEAGPGSVTLNSTSTSEVQPDRHASLASEGKRSDFESGFAYIAQQFAKQDVLDDHGLWEFWGPPPCDHCIEEIFHHFGASEEVMPPDVCQFIGLPLGSTYGAGTAKMSGWQGLPIAPGCPAHESVTSALGGEWPVDESVFEFEKAEVIAADIMTAERSHDHDAGDDWDEDLMKAGFIDVANASRTDGLPYSVDQWDEVVPI